MYLFYHLTNIENVDEKHLDYTPPTWYMDAPKKPGHFSAKPNFSSKLTLNMFYTSNIYQQLFSWFDMLNFEKISTFKLRNTIKQ